MRLLTAAAALTLSACATDSTVPVEYDEDRAPANWRAVVTEADRVRLRDWRTAFTQGLSEARAGGHAQAVAAAGALLDPDAALPEPAPPVGAYRCRTIKLGTQGSATLPYISYTWFRCEVGLGSGMLSLSKTTGSQRPVGVLFPDTRRRLIFVGTLALGDESLALSYGRDAERNVVGRFERIGERRWRLVMPSPAFESEVDVMELVPEG